MNKDYDRYSDDGSGNFQKIKRKKKLPPGKKNQKKNNRRPRIRDKERDNF